MGINGLLPFLRERAPSAYRESKIVNFCGLKIAIDISCFLYKYIRSVGDDEWLVFMINFLALFARYRINIVCVFDGPNPPIEKKVEQKRRREETKNIDSKIARLVDVKKQISQYKGKRIPESVQKDLLDIMSRQRKELHLNFNNYSELMFSIDETEKSWRKQTLYPTPEIVNTVKKLCKLLRIPVIQASGEAETICCCLAVQGDVDAVLSTDSDVLTYGIDRFLSGIDPSKETVTEYDLTEILDELAITHEQFVDICIMAGCDYNKNDDGKGGGLEGIGVKKAYDLIEKYGDIETIEKDATRNVKKEKVKFDLTSSRYERCRELFMTSEIKPLKWPSIKAIDEVKFNHFLRDNNVKYMKAEDVLKHWQPSNNLYLE